MYENWKKRKKKTWNKPRESHKTPSNLAYMHTIICLKRIQAAGYDYSMQCDMMHKASEKKRKIILLITSFKKTSNLVFFFLMSSTTLVQRGFIQCYTNRNNQINDKKKKQKK